MREARVEQYIHTETVYYEDGVEVARKENYDTYWYDTQDSYNPGDLEWEDEVGS